MIIVYLLSVMLAVIPLLQRKNSTRICMGYVSDVGNIHRVFTSGTRGFNVELHG